MKKIKLFICDNSYIYVVLEHASQTQDAILHGVYTTREAAQNKVLKVRWLNKQRHPDTGGYLCILKKPIKGQRGFFTRCFKND
jgi:hypothetical protein